MLRLKPLVYGGRPGILLFFFLIGEIAAISYSPASNCRCLTSQPCFPSGADLNAFNASVGGRLIVPRPTAYPCYPASLDANACAVVRQSASDPFWRESNPGSMQEWNFEDDGMKKCPLESANTPNAQCQQGRVPVLGVAAISVADVQTTVQFVSRNNLRLFVQNTGHDFLARSEALGSFMLWMHPIQSIVTNMTFVPDGCPAANTPAPTQAVTVMGGVPWRDVYAKVSKDTADKYIAVGGLCWSVGAAGGYFLGGGHSAVSPTYGLAVDNVLQVEIVTADGQLRLVNKCNDPDLFWALRGGGGGTFGVVTSVTYELQPSPASFTSFQLNVTPQPPGTLLTTDQVQAIYSGYIQQAAALDAARWGGYFQINAAAGFSGAFLAPTSLDVANQTATAFAAAFNGMVQQGIVSVTPIIRAETSYFQWRTDFRWPPGSLNFDVAGGRFYLGTRLIPLTALNDPVALAKNLNNGTAQVDTFLGILAPGQGLRQSDLNSQFTSVTPAWRNSFLFALYVSLWDFDTSDADIDQTYSKLNATVEVLRQAYPDSGTYFNEALPLERNFQKTFWGDTNYARLLQIKKRVDPNSLFMCTTCVGSEDWDASGNCKLNSY